MHAVEHRDRIHRTKPPWQSGGFFAFWPLSFCEQTATCHCLPHPRNAQPFSHRMRSTRRPSHRRRHRAVADGPTKRRVPRARGHLNSRTSVRPALQAGCRHRLLYSRRPSLQPRWLQPSQRDRSRQSRGLLREAATHPRHPRKLRQRRVALRARLLVQRRLSRPCLHRSSLRRPARVRVRVATNRPARPSFSCSTPMCFCTIRCACSASKSTTSSYR